MRILMLGNSFTYYHEMPETLARLLGAQVTANTRGGAYLKEQLDGSSPLGRAAQEALAGGGWDYVILQEQSFGPLSDREQYRRSVAALAELARAAGAVPVVYGTWAYREGSDKLARTGLSYEQMDRGLRESCADAAREAGCLLADVGGAFTGNRDRLELYEPEDDYHPTEAGSLLAAQTIAECIRENEIRLMAGQ